MARRHCLKGSRKSFRDILRNQFAKDATSLMLKIISARRLLRIASGTSKEVCFRVQDEALVQLMCMGATNFIPQMPPTILWVQLRTGNMFPLWLLPNGNECPGRLLPCANASSILQRVRPANWYGEKAQTV
jgi:hypothetical protein